MSSFQPASWLSEAAGGSSSFDIQVKSQFWSKTTMLYDVDPQNSIYDVKVLIYDKEGIPPCYCQIRMEGDSLSREELQNDSTLADYDFSKHAKSGASLYVFGSKRGGGPRALFFYLKPKNQFLLISDPMQLPCAPYILHRELPTTEDPISLPLVNNQLAEILGCSPDAIRLSNGPESEELDVIAPSFSGGEFHQWGVAQIVYFHRAVLFLTQARVLLSKSGVSKLSLELWKQILYLVAQEEESLALDAHPIQLLVKDARFDVSEALRIAENKLFMEPASLMDMLRPSSCPHCGFHGLNFQSKLYIVDR